MDATDTTEQLPLAKLLYQGTTDEHRAAEQTPYMLAMFEGKLTREQYRLWLVRFHYVYSALEEATASLSDHPVLGALHLPQLNRSEAIERDLAYFYGSGWRDAVEPTPATSAYVARLREVRDAWPLGLVPHHWIRYAGYLHGGATLAGLLSRTYGLADGAGMAFYDFAAIEDRPAFIADYHARMNAIDVRGADRERIVEEGRRAFAANTAITLELGLSFGLS